MPVQVTLHRGTPASSIWTKAVNFSPTTAKSWITKGYAVFWLVNSVGVFPKCSLKHWVK